MKDIVDMQRKLYNNIRVKNSAKEVVKMSMSMKIEKRENVNVKIKVLSKEIKRIFKYKALYIMMIPTMIMFIINCYMPMFGILMAFQRYNHIDGIFKSPWVGLKNFEFLFVTKDAFIITRNTVLFNLVFISLGLVGAVTLAIVVNEIRGKFAARFYQAVFILPNFISILVVSYIVYAFLDPVNGFMNKTVLPLLGIESINWYTVPKYWIFILIAVRMWLNTGMGSVLYLSTIASISPEYYESATIDGATKWQQIKYITIPMLVPLMIIITTLSIGSIIRGDFGLFYQVTQNSPSLYPVTDVIDTYVYKALINLNNFGMASAAGFYQSVVGFVLIIVTNKVVRKIDPEKALF
jgi:putative aldouronate transport system permease protein